MWNAKQQIFVDHLLTAQILSAYWDASTRKMEMHHAATDSQIPKFRTA